MIGETADVKFIDDKVAHFSFGLRHVAPVKCIIYNPGMVGPDLLLSPDTLAGNSFCVRIQENIIFVEKHAVGRIVRAVHPVGIFKIFDVDAEDNHRIHITDLVFFRKRKDCERVFFTTVE